MRRVDVSTDSFASARALQVRVESADLEDPERLAAIAAAANLTADQARQRYRPLG